MEIDELVVVIGDMFEKKTEELKQYVDKRVSANEILTESLRDDIKAIAEGHGILERKIDISNQNLSDKIDDLEDNMNIKFKSVKKDITGLKQDVTGLKIEISGVKDDMSVVKNYVIGVDAKLTEHEIILKRAR